MGSQQEHPQAQVLATWRSNAKPSSAWRRLCAKIFAGRKDKLADSHPERGTTAQDASQGKEQ